jgi:hypothetical protein
MCWLLPVRQGFLASNAPWWGKGERLIHEIPHRTALFDIESDHSSPRRNAGLWCVSTRHDQHKAQKEMWLVSGLQDHRYLSVNKDAKMPVDGPLKKRNAVRTRRYVQYHRHAGPTGSISQPVTEFTYNWKRQRPLPPGPRPQTDGCRRIQQWGKVREDGKIMAPVGAKMATRASMWHVP